MNNILNTKVYAKHMPKNKFSRCIRVLKTILIRFDNVMLRMDADAEIDLMSELC